MRRVKQALYGSLYLLIIFGLGAGIYFSYIRPTLASCVNNKKDYNEAGVDCGGVCSTACSPDAPPLSVAKASFLPLGPGKASVLAEIRNPGQAYGAEASYEVYLGSASGTPAKTGSFYIAPGDVLLLGFPGLASGFADTASVNVKTMRWIPAGSIRRANVSVNVASVALDNGLFTVSGTAVNNDDSSLGSVDLLAVFYYSNGLPAGISETSLSGLAPREARPFSILHPALSGIDKESVRVIPSAYITGK